MTRVTIVQCQWGTSKKYWLINLNKPTGTNNIYWRLNIGSSRCLADDGKIYTEGRGAEVFLMK